MATTTTWNGTKVTDDTLVEHVPLGYRMRWGDVPAWKQAHPDLQHLTTGWRVVSMASKDAGTLLIAGFFLVGFLLMKKR